MILFVGIASEQPLALAIAAAERRGVAHGVVDQRDSAFSEIRLDARASNVGGRVTTRSGEVDLASVSGVLVRLLDPESYATRAWTGDMRRRSDSFHHVLTDWLETTAARVLNRLDASAANGSKILQLRQLQALGWAVPETLVSTDPDEVRAFAARVGPVVFKSLSGVRSIVTELEPRHDPSLHKVRWLPTQFQQRIDGNDVRVHVVGDRIFATEIESEATDYRYASRSGREARMRPIDLPDEVAARCVSTAAALDLPLCGLDLRRRSDGVYVAFEANPAPAYSWYQETTGQPIAEAIVDCLAA